MIVTGISQLYHEKNMKTWDRIDRSIGFDSSKLTQTLNDDKFLGEANLPNP